MKRRHWARIGERGSLAGMLVMVRIRRRLGAWPFRVALGPVILWYFLSHGLARRASGDYLTRLDPALARRPLARLWCSYRHFLAFGRALMDKVAAWSGEYPPSRLHGGGVEHFEAAIASGRGGLVLVAHHGNLDVVNALGDHHPDLELTVMMHTRNARKFHALLERATGRRQPDLLEVTEITPATAQHLDARIRRGGFVVITADRVPIGAGRHRRLDFLGAPADFPEGPFRLATLLRCPLYTLSCVREGDGFRVDFTSFDDTRELPRRQREAWLDDAMRRHADQLAERVRRHPLQWFNFYPFWPDDTEPHHDHTP
ncbi:LpxL/LpxP family acyltransferase [Halomonas ramblicola]|uniref:LpxL/LpxP family acyltransferase n=1 Tax=Halomonas ramblicola TaxID=747349 RepID=UPI0025B44FD8|nr:glycosyl transferase [Halomonas ramblicola]MDN3521805.1 glycosyl transferase [Halomonas ramblicola]